MRVTSMAVRPFLVTPGRREGVKECSYACFKKEVSFDLCLGRFFIIMILFPRLTSSFGFGSSAGSVFPTFFLDKKGPDMHRDKFRQKIKANPIAPRGLPGRRTTVTLWPHTPNFEVFGLLCCFS